MEEEFNRMLLIIMKTLATHLKVFEGATVEENSHQYSTLMKKKSDIVSIETFCIYMIRVVVVLKQYEFLSIKDKETERRWR